MKKYCIFLFIIVVNTLFAFGISDSSEKESWQIFQNAQQEYDIGNYSSSMRLAQDAVSKRKEESQNNLRILTNSLTPYQVRKVGDLIPDVVSVLTERQEYDSLKIINKYISLFGSDFFNNSIKELTEYIKKCQEYPEAYYLIAKIYHIEGEYDMALSFLEKARSSSDILEIPAEENDILYLMSLIAEYKGDIPTQEKALLLIAKNNGDFNNETLKKAIIRTSKSVKEDNSSRIFKLYRIDAVGCVNSYNKLCKIYFDNNKYEEAYLANMYSVIIQFTHLNSLLEERESEYQYFELKDFFRKLSRYPDMINWCNETGFWENMYNIYVIGYKCGYERFPKDIIEVIRNYCPEKYWKDAAANLIM